MFKLTRTTKTKSETKSFETAQALLDYCQGNKSKSGSVVVETSDRRFELQSMRQAEYLASNIYWEQRRAEAEVRKAQFVADILAKFSGQETALQADVERFEARWSEAKAKADQMLRGEFSTNIWIEENVRPWSAKAERAKRILKILETKAYH